MMSSFRMGGNPIVSTLHGVSLYLLTSLDESVGSSSRAQDSHMRTAGSMTESRSRELGGKPPSAFVHHRHPEVICDLSRRLR